jgi:hypothetical protein
VKSASSVKAVRARAHRRPPIRRRLRREQIAGVRRADVIGGRSARGPSARGCAHRGGRNPAPGACRRGRWPSDVRFQFAWFGPGGIQRAGNGRARRSAKRVPRRSEGIGEDLSALSGQSRGLANKPRLCASARFLQARERVQDERGSQLPEPDGNGGFHRMSEYSGFRSPPKISWVGSPREGLRFPAPRVVYAR